MAELHNGLGDIGGVVVGKPALRVHSGSCLISYPQCKHVL